MTSEKGCRKDKNQNIQVFVRLRPLNQRERDIKSLGVIEVLHNREVIVRQSQQTTHTKKFTFDRAFGPNAKQVEVYQEVVSPLIEEVLAGYNCTVFAYGQTGTGKTHTMVGENTTDEQTNWQNDPLAGIIPRALSQLFDELRISNTEYTVRVSYLELYNEELFDLLSSSEDNSKLRIYEDVTRKGSNIVNGLEEITVYNKNEVYKIMAQGQERKRVASTLMNAQSSRSHTVFTIVVHMKENSPEGEELVKIGKLNLVDLAGSENISKAGSDNPAKKERARECVNINQSLLTLGRVITALVERHPHIPYRESKLTRILQESLGGRTKTSIIATISPGHKDLEETMSTLEYANRAKNIQNKPEVNQKMTKKAILKEYAEEIDRLKRDLQAARDKNGVYLANETFTELTLKQEEQRKEIQELLLKKRAMEEEKDKMENVFSDLNKTLEKRISELNATKNKLSNTKTQLANTNNMLRSTKLQFEEQAHIVEVHKATEEALSSQAKALLATADVATTHVKHLHDTVDKRKTVESTNLQVTRSYREQSSELREKIVSRADHFTQSLAEQLSGLHSALENFASTNTKTLQESKTKLEELVQNIVETMNEIKSLSTLSHSKLLQATDSHRVTIKTAVETHHCAVQTALAALLHSVAGCVQSAQSHDVADSVARYIEQWYTGATERVYALRRSHAAFETRRADTETARAHAARTHRDCRREHAEKRAGNITARIAEIEQEKADIESRLSRQLSDIEAERRATDYRLQQWMEEERRSFEERLRAHVEIERAAMEDRLAKKLQDIETERAHLTARLSRHIEWQQQMLQESREEIARAEQQLLQSESITQESSSGAESYSKEFDEGASAITADMEALSSNVVEVVRHVYCELLRALLLAKEQVEKDTQSVAAQDAATSQQFADESETALNQLVSANKEAMDTVLSYIETTNTSTTSTLTSLSHTASTLLSLSRSHAESHESETSALRSRLGALAAALRSDVTAHAELEARWLGQEYKVYSPTGSTPSRLEYRYPRSLAATSPHERILARFRAMRNGNQDDDCIVLESDVESSPASECESSLSDDSAASALPSPLAPPTPLSSRALRPTLANGKHNAIVKCTSESDIYDIKRNREPTGKENTDRSVCYREPQKDNTDRSALRKPSKLPAPASLKKPLVERNGTH